MPLYYVVANRLDDLKYYWIGLLPTYSVVRAIQLFDLKCAYEARIHGAVSERQ